FRSPRLPWARVPRHGSERRPPRAPRRWPWRARQTRDRSSSASTRGDGNSRAAPGWRLPPIRRPGWHVGRCRVKPGWIVRRQSNRRAGRRGDSGEGDMGTERVTQPSVGAVAGSSRSLQRSRAGHGPVGRSPQTRDHPLSRDEAAREDPEGASAATAGQVTRVLHELRGGDREAMDRLLPLVYDELRRIAARQLRRGTNNVTVQPTMLVHEAYMKL